MGGYDLSNSMGIGFAVEMGVRRNPLYFNSSFVICHSMSVLHFFGTRMKNANPRLPLFYIKAAASKT